MAQVKNAYRFNCSVQLWDDAMVYAETVVDNFRRRDYRIEKNREARKQKIAKALERWFKENSIVATFIGERGDARKADFRTGQGALIDIRTQANGYLPRDHWNCEITSEHRHGDANIYVFAKLYESNEVRTVYIVGWISRDSFDAQGVFRKVGDYLPGDHEVAYAKIDVKIEQLEDMQSLPEILQ